MMAVIGRPSRSASASSATSFLMMLMILLALHGSTTTAVAAAADADNDNQQCGLYLAVSSTASDHTVWGIYAGKNYKKGDPVGSPDLAVNAINLRANNVLGDDAPEDVQDRLLRTVEFLEESFWVPDSAGGYVDMHRTVGW